MEGSSNQWDRIQRYFGDIAFAHLAQKTVGILGLGSGGGIVALELAKLGVGGFVLVDPELLEEKNIIRHVLDLRYVGWSKVDGVKELILHRNPNARVMTIQDTAQQARKPLADVDLFVVCVDSESARHSINMLARELGVGAVTAGVYEKASGGDIFITYPDRDACYACIASELAADDSTEVPENLDYGSVRPDGTLQGQPGLGLHVGRVALMQADIALRQLLADTNSPMSTLPGNVLIMANEPQDIGTDEGGKPISLKVGEARWFVIKQKPTCRVCSIKPSTDVVSVQDLLNF